jgi:cytochrome P450
MIGLWGLREYFQSLIRRRRSEPRDDMISALIAAQPSIELGEHDLLANVVFLFFAGQETTGRFLGDAARTLLERPDDLEALRQDPALMSPAVEELLRWIGPTQTLARLAPAPLTLGGHPVQPGQTVHLGVLQANRDAAAFHQPHQFSLRRLPNPHLQFGGGIHYCLGAQLARMEAQIALNSLFRRFPRLATRDSGGPGALLVRC